MLKLGIYHLIMHVINIMYNSKCIDDLLLFFETLREIVLTCTSKDYCKIVIVIYLYDIDNS